MFWCFRAPRCLDVTEKMRTRFEDIRVSGVGIPARAYMHTCYTAASLYRYMFFCNAFRRGVYRILQGVLRLLKPPWNSITYDVACNLQLLGLPTDFTDKRTLNMATRPVQNTAMTTRRVFDEIRAYAQSHDAALRTDRKWHATSIVSCSQGVGEEFVPRANRAARMAGGGGGGSPRESVRLLKGARRREVDQEFGDFATAAPTLVGRARRAPERMAFVRGDAPAGRICVQRAAHLIIRICGAVEADRQTQYVQCIVFREWMRSHLVFRVQGSTEEMASFVLGNLRGPPRPSILVATARDMAPAAFDTIRSGLRVSPHH